MKKIVLTFSCVLFFINTSVICQDWSAEQEEAWNIVVKMTKSWADRDLDGYMSCLHESFIGWFNDDPLPIDKKTLRNWEDYWLNSTKIHREQSWPVSIKVTDNVAIVNIYAMELREDNTGTKVSNSKWTFVCKKENGEWLIMGLFGGRV